MSFGKKTNLSLLINRPSQDFFYEGEFLNADCNQSMQNDILLLRGFVKKDFCNKFLDFFSIKTEWKKSFVQYEEQNGLDPANSPRQSWQINLANYKNADKMVFAIFNLAFQLYKKTNPHLEVSSDEGYSLLRYQAPIGEYKEHIDFHQINQRVISGLIYPNDDYEGGEIYFSNQDIKIKPQEGDVILFPSGFTHPHASIPVTQGTKYSIVTWFR